MYKMPPFLNLGAQPGGAPAGPDAGSRLADYQPLLGLWLIDLALACDWVRKPPSDSLSGTFCDSDYVKVTGLQEVHKLFPEEDPIDEEIDALLGLSEDELLRRKRRPGSVKAKVRRVKETLTALLKRRRQESLETGVNPDLPLFQNIERLGRLLHLDDAEKVVLAFAACLSGFQDFRAALMPNQTQFSDGDLGRALAALTGHPEAQIRKAICRDGVLLTAGLVRIKHEEEDVESKIRLRHDLCRVIFDPLSSDDELSRRMLRPASAGVLQLQDFPHLAEDARLLCDYLKGAIASCRAGVNILLYGPPGTGKSLLARHIANELGKPLLFRRASDLLDKYVGGTEKGIAAMFEQARDEEAVLVLDEADSFLSDRTAARNQWEVTQANELLTQMECFEGLFFATTNLMDKLDAASLRRFSHKIRFDYLTAEQRWRLFHQEAHRLGITSDDAASQEFSIRRLDLVTPGNFATAIKKLKLSHDQPDAGLLLKALNDEARVKRRGQASIGFM